MVSPSEKYARYEIAEDALRKLGDFLDEWEGSDWAGTRPAQEVRGILDVADARIRMAASIRDRRNARWLARVTSFAFPRRVNGDDRLCFTVDITDGAKSAKGRKVEVQIPDSEAERLARQILGLAGRKR